VGGRPHRPQARPAVRPGQLPHDEICRAGTLLVHGGFSNEGSPALTREDPGELALGGKLPNDALLVHDPDGNVDEEASALSNVLNGL
jgi:hypothetical protein